MTVTKMVKMSELVSQSCIVPLLLLISYSPMSVLAEFLSQLFKSSQRGAGTTEGTSNTVAKAQKGLHFWRYPYRWYNKLGLVSF